jgi:hypothetical protein
VTRSIHKLGLGYERCEDKGEISTKFLFVPQKPIFFSSSKIRREIIRFGKTLFWDLVPCVEVTLVSKLHLIWSAIAQESRLGRKGRIFWRNCVFQRPPTGQYPAPPDNVRRDPDKV